MKRKGNATTTNDNFVEFLKRISSGQAVSITELENVRTMLLNSIQEGKTSGELLVMLATLNLKEVESLKQGKVPIDSNSYLLEAKQLFYMAITMGNEVEPHFGLFKLALLEEDYFEAFCQLQVYERKLDRPSNFQLLYKMLKKILGSKECIESSNNSYIQDSKIDYEPLLNNYRMAETAFNIGDYQRMVRHISVCESLIAKKELPIDLWAVSTLANTIFSLYREKQKSELRLAFANSSDVGERMVSVHKLIELDDKDVESFFLLMDAYIDLKAYTPLVECIQKIKALEPSLSEQQSLSLYERLTAEIFMEGLNLKTIHETLVRGSKLQAQALYQEAISHYGNAYEAIKFPYYLIQRAEVYYSMENYEQAICDCNNYMQEGYLHYVEASILLYKCYRKKGDLESSFRVALECYQKARMKERGISFDSWMCRLNNGYDGKEDTKTPKRYIFQSSSS